MMSLIFISSLSLNLVILISFSPIVLGIKILLLSLSFAILLSTIISSWLPIATFLIYVGGLIVIFAYFLAIQPNHYMSFIASVSAFAITAPIILLSLNNIIIFPHTFHYSINTIFAILVYNSSLSILLIFLLFFILIVSVKITSPRFGPIRPFS